MGQGSMPFVSDGHISFYSAQVIFALCGLLPFQPEIDIRISFLLTIFFPSFTLAKPLSFSSLSTDESISFLA